MLKNAVLLFSVSLLFFSCLQVDNTYDKIPDGTWRGILELDEDKMIIQNTGDYNADIDESLSSSEGTLPFLFDVEYDDNNDLVFNLHNGTETLVYDSIVFREIKDRERDSIVWYFPLFDTHIEALVENDVMEGYFVKDYLENYRIPFVAFFGQNFRFSNANETPTADLSGNWATTFFTSGDNSYPALGEFSQTENHLEGTFRTNTGDYRFLEGTVQGDRFAMSTFDGTHAFLFEGRIENKDSITGVFRSGNQYRETWAAHRGDGVLSNPDEMTKPTTSQPIDFTFPDENGNPVSLDDDQFKNKPVVLQIMGTWCPNCMDESNFLKSYKSSHPDTDLEIIALAFERYEDPEKSKETIAKYRKKMDIPYPILLAGTSTSKESAMSSLPFIDKLYSYPTMIVLDRDHRIVKIHTGFNGPATSEYPAFTENFETLITSLQTKQ